MKIVFFPVAITTQAGIYSFPHDIARKFLWKQSPCYYLNKEGREREIDQTSVCGVQKGWRNWNSLKFIHMLACNIEILQPPLFMFISSSSCKSYNERAREMPISKWQISWMCIISEVLGHLSLQISHTFF